MISPTPRCLALFAAGIPLAVLPAAIAESLWPAWVAWTAACMLLCGIDALLLEGEAAVEWEVRAPAAMGIGEEAEARVRVGRRGPGRTLEVLARVDLDDLLEPCPALPLSAAAGGHGEAPFPLRPRRRGTLALRALWLRWTGPLGLLRRQVRRPLDRTLAVVPAIGRVRSTALRFFGSRDFRSGMKVERYLGDGSEFESLREFVAGFDPRALSWRASARHRRLLVRQYRAERNHQVVVALDTGRLMSEPLAGIPRLDHAVTAALLLGYSCVRTGDRVGLFSFGGKAEGFTPPAAGLGAFRTLQARSAELEYGTAETNFSLGLGDLQARLHRRSLVVVFTDFADSIAAGLMVDNLVRLSARHVVLFVALRDPGVTSLAAARPEDIDGLHRAVVASTLVRDREMVLRRLRRRGVHCIDAPPDLAPVALLNRYLELKRKEIV
ncbi:MAG: DUF58 domain-containing protein [Planctomycetes bacterium]|nr:DUF58 domain-containing protein [Planctomycetota bacterium]